MKRLLLIWNGVVAIKTIPMTPEVLAERKKSWKALFPGRQVRIEEIA